MSGVRCRVSGAPIRPQATRQYPHPHPYPPPLPRSFLFLKREHECTRGKQALFFSYRHARAQIHLHLHIHIHRYTQQHKLMLTSSLLSPISFTQPIYFSLAPPLISFRSFSLPLLSSSFPSRPPFLSLFLPHSACLAVAGQPHTPALPVEHCRRPRGWRWAWGVTVAASRPLRPCSSHLSQHFRRRCCYRFIHLRLSLLFSPSFSLPSFLLFASCYLILLTSVLSFFAMCRISLSLFIRSPFLPFALSCPFAHLPSHP